MRFTLFSLILILSLFSCKNDPKTENINNTVSSTESNQRYQDSLLYVEKMTQKGQQVSPETITKMLDEKANPQVKTRNKPTGFIPNICSLISQEDVSAAFGLNLDEVNVTNGNRSNLATDSSKSCFWRWPGGGILVQVSGNPFPGEVTDWGSKYMNSKKMNGEKTTVEKDDRFLFKDFDGPGKYNIYNEELGRYYISKDEDYIITLIFNGNYTNSKKMNIANSLLKKVHDQL